ncbi:NASP-related protein sim3 [Fulvia fulva]|uniref:NASP-related protein sim3 n=1 Tax=Passalora fulva TaxID=5499 RepID=A0A9Q8PGN3_PASFU|nr:NASP-related protein sim3 [Fulvia fulva]UJO22096.1 NASP-related protein sim3 [Fulvia fulva]
MADNMIEEPIVEATPAEELPAKLEQLKANATKEYSLKHYDAAAEIYSDAAAVQDQINGEMAVENADLLYQYGRCLYHVAVASADVLGGKVAGSGEPKRKKRKTSHAESRSAPLTNGGEGESGGSLIADAIKSGEQKTAEEVVEAVVDEKDGAVQEEPTSSNPFFNITGDDNFTDSEDEDEQGDGREEEEDDFQTAYEVLDMARILFTRKLQALSDSKGKSSAEDSDTRQLRERLADTHDLQADISLENERFQDAVKDTQDALALKLQLYPEESSLVAEGHYKLSLALEFASVKATRENKDGEAQVAEVDEEMREQAAREMELAIASCNLRISKEEAKMASMGEAEAKAQEKETADVKDMVTEMEQRLTDLRQPPTALGGLGPAGAPGTDEDALRGVLGAMLGESKADQAKRLQEATQNANDLTGMVKKKKPKPAAAEPVVEGKGKRKAEDVVEGATNGTANGKKVKFSEGTKTEDGDGEEPTLIADN